MIKGWVVALQFAVRTSSSEKAAMPAVCQKMYRIACEEELQVRIV